MDPGELSKRLEYVANNLEQFADVAIDAGLVEADGSIAERIYNKNEDINGGSLGGYSEEYKEFRKSLNLDVSRKNLQLTDEMRKTTFIDFDKDEIRLSEAKDKRNNKVSHAEKARFQEQQLSTKIFEPSERETDESAQVVDDVFAETIVKFITTGAV